MGWDSRSRDRGGAVAAAAAGCGQRRDGWDLQFLQELPADVCRSATCLYRPAFPHVAGVIVPPLPERNVVEKYKMNTGGWQGVHGAAAFMGLVVAAAAAASPRAAVSPSSCSLPALPLLPLPQTSLRCGGQPSQSSSTEWCVWVARWLV